jgi:hypothetical protein
MPSMASRSHGSTVDVGGLALGEELPRMPAELRAAFEAAGTVEEEGIEPGEADSTIAMPSAPWLASRSP